MDLTELTAISPIDGRYRGKTATLAAYFSECALMRYRVRVEVEYFIALSAADLPQVPALTTDKAEQLRDIYRQFTPVEAAHIKEIEQVTNHDVKAVEYFLKERFEALGLGAEKEFVHFGLTSQDVNNTASPLSLKDALQEVYLPAVETVLTTLRKRADEWADVAMLARTHGQPASPTRLGKELMVFVSRLQRQIDELRSLQVPAKFGGATGNFNAHHAAYPDRDWVAFANHFVADILGLRREPLTTQISNYDDLASIFDNLRRINVVLLDLCRDVWLYVMEEYFKQRIKPGEVGSSAMPHKVNPIDFENAEGNLGLANAIFDHLSNKLPVSRLQRDLTDSTVLRNVGVPLGHTLIALASLQRGLGKLLLNREAIARDLEANWAVVAEGFQTILRREGYPNPYETLKELTRTNGRIDHSTMEAFINGLNVADSVKDELRAITPQTYLGVYQGTRNKE